MHRRILSISVAGVTAAIAVTGFASSATAAESSPADECCTLTYTAKVDGEPVATARWDADANSYTLCDVAADGLSIEGAVLYANDPDTGLPTKTWDAAGPGDSGHDCTVGYPPVTDEPMFVRIDAYDGDTRILRYQDWANA